MVYLRGHEGRGIGLLHKLQAYELQDGGRDTVDANLELGLPADARDYGAGAQILARPRGHARCGCSPTTRTSAPALEGYGIDVVEQVPLQVARDAGDTTRLPADQAGPDGPRPARPRPPRRSRAAPGSHEATWSHVSGAGSPTCESTAAGCGSRSSRPGGTRKVMDGLLAGARAGARRLRVDRARWCVRVPGLVRAAGRGAALARAGYDAVVALGVVIRGGTPHFEYVCQAATDGLSRVAVDTGVPSASACSPATRRAGARPRRARRVAARTRGRGSGGGGRYRRGAARAHACAGRS